MLEKLLNATRCDLCGGHLEIDQENTIDDYSATINIDINNVANDMDAIVGKYLVFSCLGCGELYKYTYKDLERNLRKALTEKYIIMLAKGEFLDSPLINKFYVYCGKCNGYDGSGSCPKNVFYNCKIKRFPLNEL